MAIFPLIVFLVVMAVCAWLISIAPFIGPRWKTILYYVLGGFAVLWIANYIGLIDYLKGLHF